MRRRTVLGLGAALAARPAFAIDPGVVAGGYRDDQAEVGFTHAVAVERDNTEGLLDSDREIRLALTDRDVPARALFGQAFPPIWWMAAQGQVRGVLLSFDPADRTGMVVTVLARPEPGASLANISITNTEGLWDRLEVSPTRIVGALRKEASETLAATFSAPVFRDRLVADLKGPAAAASEPAQAVLARAQALARGDMAAARSLSTAESAAGLDGFSPETLALAKREIPKLIARLKAVKRVVVREQTAVVFLGPREYATATREGGVWKVAD